MFQSYDDWKLTAPEPFKELEEDDDEAYDRWVDSQFAE